MYDSAGTFSSGLCPVETNGMFGYIDHTGTYRIPPKFYSAYDFEGGVAVVDFPFDLIDTSGDVVLSGITITNIKKYAAAADFSEGLSPIGDDYNLYGYVDKTGDYVIPPQFDAAGSFYEGLAAVLTHEKVGFIDKKGRFVIKPQFDYTLSFKEGLAAVKVDTLWGFIDKTGTYIIKPRFEDAGSFTEGQAVVELRGKWGIINKAGEFIIKPSFSSIGELSEGLYSVQIGDKWGYIDTSGTVVIAPQFFSALEFTEGLAAVQVYSADRKWGFIKNPLK